MSLLADIVDGLASGIGSLFGGGSSAPATNPTQSPSGPSAGGIISGILGVAAPFITAAVTAPDKPEYPEVPDSVKNDPRVQELLGPSGGYDSAPTVNYPSAFQLAFPYALNNLLSPSTPSFLAPQQQEQKVAPVQPISPGQVQTPATQSPTSFSNLALGDQPKSLMTVGQVTPSSAAQAAIASYEPLISAAASKYEIDPALLKAVITQESGGNARAVGGAGEIGLTQIKPSTARDFIKGVTRQELFKPETNINASAAYIRKLQDTFGNDYDKVISSYNAGQGNVIRGTVSRRTRENYLPQVKGFLDFYRGQANG